MKSFQAQTHYEVLEVSVGASLSEVKSAYERLSQLYSDDQVVLYGLIDPSRATALRARLKEAVDVLTDEERREAYDVKLGLPPRNPPRVAAAVKPAVVSSGAVAATGWGAFTYASAPIATPQVSQQGSTYSWPISAPRNVAAPTPFAVAQPVAAPVAAPPVAPPPIVAPPPPVAAVPVAAVPDVAPVPGPAEEAAPVAEAPKSNGASALQLDLGMATGAASNWGVRDVVEEKPIVAAPVEPFPEPAPAPVTPEPVAAAAPEPEPPAATATMSSTSSEPFTAPSITPAPMTTLTPPPAPVAAPQAPAAEPEVPRLSDDVELAIIPARATPAREFKVEAPPRPYEVPADVEFNGALLRQVRMARGLSLSQLAERTRIGTKHLENVEADRYDALPVVVYLRGILMNLARELGLDGLRVSKSYLAFVEAHRSKG